MLNRDSMSVTEDAVFRLENELVDILAEDMPTPEALRDAVQKILSEEGEGIYSDLLWRLTSLRLDEHEAKLRWKQVLEHKYLISQRLGRNVGVRVATHDFFVNILGQIVRPCIIDPKILNNLYREATTDPLTGASNRRHFESKLSEELERNKRYKKPFSLCMFDLDDFKKLNDEKGHYAGDCALKKVVRGMYSVVRTCDRVARWGGEEFFVLLPETDRGGALAVADRIRVRVEDDLENDAVTISGGISVYPEDGENERELISYADRALYHAKSAGKNRIVTEPIERRRYPRLDSDLEISVAPIEVEMESSSSRSINVGAGGIAFVRATPLNVSTCIRGEITIQDKRPSFFGRVARIEELPASNKFEIGIEFTQISHADLEIILQHCQ